MASLMRLHLKYRLWIADMNADINMLRIFSDYLDWLKTQNNKDIEKEINFYEKDFLSLRKEPDDLKHEMHIIKMKLAALSKGKHEDVQAVKQAIDHESCKERYKIFRKKFKATKKAFAKLEHAV